MENGRWHVWPTFLRLDGYSFQRPKEPFRGAIEILCPHDCPGSKGTDVFAQSPSLNDNYYIFQPFILIGPLIKFMKQEVKRLTMILPDVSPRKYWWPILDSLSADKLLLGNRGQSTIIEFPPNRKQLWHTRPLPWDLYTV